jgi:glycosyltransferase involved in cell wall biosynthesis
MYRSHLFRPAGPDGMHILMIAPEPFFEPRGTPFSEFHRIRALTTLGHTVDLVTYPFGRDVTMPGLQIIRCLRPPFMRRIGIGPSWKKVPLDAALSLTAARAALTRRYDAVHSHEEGGGIGVVLARLLRIPHLYDMHSSLPQQVANFGYGESTWLSTALGWLERVMIRNSKVIIVICQALETTVRGVDASVPTVVIENAPGSGAVPQIGAGVPVRTSLGLAEGDPIVLYTGTFENYQGLDLLYAAMALVAKVRPDARLVMVGGEPAQVEEARGRVRALGLAASVIFTGQRPADEIPAYLDAATALASPRSTGTNTPLKIYQYLRSGRPIVATRLLTHTQVLSDDIAFLADATPAAFGAAILEALADPARARAIGDRARQVATTRYSDEAFVAKTRTAIDELARSDRREVAGRLA